ncbi:hypothetical protein [Massilia sp. YIM B02443]|uniref:hypothetical protein n=1 Tax=Massilia sp. YIM B02443 TaxID=3050127 RepID=UPI0025B6D766|nr:hypothetical protein [Massilia sp. YIM B02443]MDN4035438.1 hypothetical protein [Massilia sp. YIM B02443]
MKFRRPQALQRHAVATPLPSPYARILNGTVFLSILTWAAYLVGVVYHQTLLDDLGIDSDIYPQDAARYFIFAFYAFFSSFISLLSPMLSDFTVAGVILLAWILIMVVVLLMVMLEERLWVKRIQAQVKNARRLRQISFSIALPIFGSLITFYTPILIAFFLILPVAVGQGAGKRDAKNYLKRIEKGCEVVSKQRFFCAEIMEDGKPIAFGLVIAATDKHVAIVEQNRSRSIPLEGKELVRRRHETVP